MDLPFWAAIGLRAGEARRSALSLVAQTSLCGLAFFGFSSGARSFSSNRIVQQNSGFSPEYAGTFLRARLLILSGAGRPWLEHRPLPHAKPVIPSTPRDLPSLDLEPNTEN